MLKLDKVNTYYGESHVLFDISLEVNQGEIVALVGRNGVGKTTTMMTIKSDIRTAPRFFLISHSPD